MFITNTKSDPQIIEMKNYKEFINYMDTTNRTDKMSKKCIKFDSVIKNK
jgi:hypothetical protein